jgi:hypothetical protein
MLTLTIGSSSMSYSNTAEDRADLGLVDTTIPRVAAAEASAACECLTEIAGATMTTGQSGQADSRRIWYTRYAISADTTCRSCRGS